MTWRNLRDVFRSKANVREPATIHNDCICRITTDGGKTWREWGKIGKASDAEGETP